MLNAVPAEKQVQPKNSYLLIPGIAKLQNTDSEIARVR